MYIYIVLEHKYTYSAVLKAHNQQLMLFPPQHQQLYVADMQWTYQHWLIFHLVLDPSVLSVRGSMRLVHVNGTGN